MSENPLIVLDDYLVGRRDVFAVQQPDGSYRPMYRPLTPADLQNHLDGRWTLGTYTIAADGMVRCVTWDFDNHEDSRLAVWEALQFVPYLQGPWMMFESGNKGAHVVQSFSPRIPADEAYQYAREVARRAGLWEAGEPTIECNPKQPRLTDRKSLGNLTKLPLGIHQKTGRRARMLEGSTVAYCPRPQLPEATSEEAAEAPLRPAPSGRKDGWISLAFAGDARPKRGRNNTLKSFRAVLEGLDFPPDLVRYCMEYMNTGFEEPLDGEELERTVMRDL